MDAPRHMDFYNYHVVRMRVAAVKALGDIQDKSATPGLQNILEDSAENFMVRITAAESLAALGK